MLTRKQKEEIVKQLAEDLKKAKSVIFVDYKGLNVDDLYELRTKLIENDAHFAVIKKTLLNLALLQAGIKGVEATQFEGQVGYVLSGKDEVAGAKLFAKTIVGKKQARFYGGIVEGTIIDEEKAKEFAKLSSKQELQSKIVGVLQAPLYQLRYLLEANQRGLLSVLQQAANK